MTVTFVFSHIFRFRALIIMEKPLKLKKRSLRGNTKRHKHRKKQITHTPDTATLGSPLRELHVVHAVNPVNGAHLLVVVLLALIIVSTVIRAHRLHDAIALLVAAIVVRLVADLLHLVARSQLRLRALLSPPVVRGEAQQHQQDHQVGAVQQQHQQHRQLRRASAAAAAA